jgi:TRAP-type mannitol/chloroaromatic compound transport system substrate-binding protein
VKGQKTACSPHPILEGTTEPGRENFFGVIHITQGKRRKKMKRKRAGKGMAAGLLAGLFLIVFAFGTAGAQTMNWKMQSTWPSGIFLHESAVELSKRIVEMSGGRLKIDMSPAGTIVPAFEVLDAVHRGTLQGAHGWAPYWVGKAPSLNLFASVAGGPFGMDNIDYVGWLFHGGGLQLYREIYTDVLKMKVYVIPTDIIASEPLGWFKQPMKTTADLKGKKFRATGLTAEIYKEFGMSVITLPGGEIVSAIDKGMLDGAEWMDPTMDKELGLMDVAKYYHAPGMHRHTGTLELLINMDAWNKLPADLKAIVEVATRENLLRSWLDLTSRNLRDLEELKTKHKVNMVETSKEIIMEILKAWDKVAERYSAKDPVFAKVYASQKEWAKKMVDYRRTFYAPYDLPANYYWPKK